MIHRLAYRTDDICSRNSEEEVVSPSQAEPWGQLPCQRGPGGLQCEGPLSGGPAMAGVGGRISPDIQWPTCHGLSTPESLANQLLQGNVEPGGGWIFIPHAAV